MSYEHEENTESFRSARRKKQNRRQCLPPTAESLSTIDPELLMKIIENKILGIRSSYFWVQFHSHLSDWISRQVTSIEILCFGLGHVASSISSQYQYALLRLIGETCADRIQTIFLYDPIWTRDEEDFLRKSNYQLLTENNQAFQTIVRPSLIYVPFCSKPIHNNLLYSNWTKSQLREILFFGNSLERFFNEVQFDRTKFFYIAEAARFAADISLPTFEECSNAFNEQVFTSFDRVSIPRVNEKTLLLPSKREKNKRLNGKIEELKRMTIEEVTEEIWSTHTKPMYSDHDEIVLDSLRNLHL